MLGVHPVYIIFIGFILTQGLLTLISTLSFLINITISGNAERTKDKMYDGISGTTACYRRLNATHQIGCSCEKNLGNLNFILNTVLL